MKTISRRIVPLLLSLAMVLWMAQGIGTISVFAEGEKLIIGGVTVDSADWYAVTDGSGGVSTIGADANNWQIHATTSGTTATVTLKNANIKNPNGGYHAIETSGYDLNILLEGVVNRIGLDPENSDKYAIYSSTGGSVSIIGTGNLSILGSYGVCVNGPGNVGIDIEGELFVESKWQMVSTGGNLTVKAKSMDMEGYYIQCGSGSAFFIATGGDVVVKGTYDYGIKTYGDVMVSAMNGKASVTGGNYALYSSKENTMTSISAKNDIALEGTVQGGETYISSQTGDITVKGFYQAISGVKTSATLNAPQGDITLTAGTTSNCISGSYGYTLDITAGGKLDAVSGYGIYGYKDATIKANNVKLSLLSDGYSINGGALTITNPTGGSCKEINIFGGGGDRDAITATDLIIKAEKVTITADADAANAIKASGNVNIGDTGMIVGAISVGGTKTIDARIQQVEASGGDVSTMELDLYHDTPKVETAYQAGDGYAIWNPTVANDAVTSGTLTLNNAAISVTNNSAIYLPELPITIVATGTNNITNTGDNQNAIDGYDNVTLQGTGKLVLAGKENAINCNSLTITGGVTVTATGSIYSNDSIVVSTTGTVTADSIRTNSLTHTGTGTVNACVYHSWDSVANAYDLTVYGNANYNGFDPFDKLTVPSGAKLTIPVGKSLILSGLSMSNISVVGTIVNNGEICLDESATQEDVNEVVKTLKPTGTGIIRISTDDGPICYTNSGVKMNVMNGGLDLSGGVTSGNGYTFTGNGTSGYTLTLTNLGLTGALTLPAGVPVTVQANSQSFVDSINFTTAGYCNVTFTGSAPLTVLGNISGSNNNGDTVTVQGGTKMTVAGQINIGASGGADGTLNVSGTGTTLEVASQDPTGVYCDTVKVQGGATLNVTASSRGINAGKGGVTVIGGSALMTGCDYGMYIIGGKLTVDDTSKLITNGAIAPFCIVDDSVKSGGTPKLQGAVLSLANLPAGTAIRSVVGSDPGCGYTYWSLVLTGGDLGVVNGTESSEPATLTGAAKGLLTFAKAAGPTPNPTPNPTPSPNPSPTPGDGGNGNSGNNGGSNTNGNTSGATVDNATNNGGTSTNPTQPAPATTSAPASTQGTAPVAEKNPVTGNMTDAIPPVALLIITAALGILMRRRKNKKA